MKVFRSDANAVEPHEVECESMAWPKLDAERVTIYENTHFATVEECWEHIRMDVEAHISLDGAAVTEAKRRLAVAEKNAGEAAERFTMFKDKLNAFKRNRLQQ